MNLAIIIGVSKYNNFNNLIQCKKDAESMFSVLNRANKYEEILYIDKTTVSGAILNQLDAFVAKYKGKEINEILLYFSGHGLTKDNEFYYCTSNTDETKINSSSLNNNDIDLLIKSLSPKTYVKIIDACQSGNAYIKGEKDSVSILEKNKDSFENCYFYSSSQSNQDSKVLKSLSSFTLTILTIIKSSYDNNKLEIKYRDLSNELADSYLDNPVQTPFFVQQGTLSEVFLNLTEEMVTEINSFLLEENFKEEKEENIETISMNLSEDAAIVFKNNLLIDLEKKLKNNSTLLKKYSYKIIRNDQVVENIVSRKKVCNWVIENKKKYFIFAKPTTRRVLKSGKLFSLYNSDEDYDFITDNYEVNVDKTNYQMSFDYISTIHGFPKLKCQIVCIYSLAKLYFIYAFGSSSPESWDEYGKYEINGNITIKVINFNVNTTDRDAWLKEIAKEFKGFADDYISTYLEAIL